MAIPSFDESARELADIGRRFHARGWAFGTSGNFSAVTSRDPLRLAISSSSIPKGTMRASDIIEVDASGKSLSPGAARPSAETLLHIEIASRLGAGAVLHTHSVWSTILSGAAGDAGVTIEGYEMLKGLEGVRTHAHCECIPVIDNDQDMPRLAGVLGRTLEEHPAAHAVLLKRHGLYTWGATLADAERHVEILEFLFEATARAQTLGGG